jgi:hypothetical protein
MNIHPTAAGLQAQLETALANSGCSTTFSSLLIDFLKGSGIPLPQLFAEAKQHFNLIINLENVNNNGFQAWMFCWASTGSCDRASNAPHISVSSISFFTISQGCSHFLSGAICG